MTALASAAPAPRRTAPVIRWQLPLPGWGEPAADDSAAFFLTRTHEVVCVDAATGSIRWRSHTGGSGDVPTGTQVRLASPRVVVGDGAIVAFDRASGRPVWRFEASDGDDPGVFLGGVDADLVVAGSPRGRVYAVDAVSGALRWTHEIAPGGRRVVFPPVQVGPLIVASFATFDGPLSGGLVGFDRSGRRRWTHRFEAGAAAAGPPLVVAGVVVVARTDGRIEMVRPASGRPVWVLGPEAPSAAGAGGRDIRALASRGNRLVVTSLTGPIRAYDVRSRRQHWQYVDGPADAVALRARAYGGQLYVPYSDGSLVALDLQTGTERWRTDDGTRAFDWPPAASATAVFAPGADALWAFALDPLDTALREEHDHR